MGHKQVIEKIAKRMPYTLPDGSYATPRDYDPGHNEPDDINKYIDEDDAKIPSHFKGVGEKPNGDVLFVDTKSHKSNPDYYLWDHGIGEHYKLSDSKKQDMFSTAYETSLMKQMREKGIKYNDVDNLSVSDLEPYGFQKRNFGQKLKESGKKIKETAPAAVIGAAMGGAMGGPKGALVGAGLFGVPAAAIAGDGIKHIWKNKGNEEEVRSNLKDAIYDNDMNDRFMSQYRKGEMKMKQAHEIVNETFDKVAGADVLAYKGKEKTADEIVNETFEKIAETEKKKMSVGKAALIGGGIEGGLSYAGQTTNALRIALKGGQALEIAKRQASAIPAITARNFALGAGIGAGAKLISDKVKAKKSVKENI